VKIALNNLQPVAGSGCLRCILLTFRLHRNLRYASVMEKALHKIAAVAFSVLALNAVGNAQLPTSGSIFFGYSYSRGQVFSGASVASANMNGWEASAQGKFSPWLDGVADFDWHYGGHDFITCGTPPCVPAVSHVNGTRISLLFGPRVLRSMGRYTPFAEMLVGFAHQTDVGTNVSTLSNSDTAFALAIGGGLDYKLVKGVAWRSNVEYLHLGLFGGQNGLRISSGIAFHF
jgi:opacity protein-like surface antigen